MCFWGILVMTWSSWSQNISPYCGISVGKWNWRIFCSHFIPRAGAYKYKKPPNQNKTTQNGKKTPTTPQVLQPWKKCKHLEKDSQQSQCNVCLEQKVRSVLWTSWNSSPISVNWYSSTKVDLHQMNSPSLFILLHLSLHCSVAAYRAQWWKTAGVTS